MQHLLTALCVVGLTAALASQGPPRSTNSVEFQSGGAIEVAYDHIDVAAGATLDTLMSKSEQGAGLRQIFNQRAFKDKIKGKLTVDTLTEIAGNELDAGTYNLNFRIDDDLIWYMVVLSEDDEEIFSATLAVEKDEKHSSGRLVIRPLAEDNADRTGNLEIRFGKLAAQVTFKATGDAKGEKEKKKENEEEPENEKKS